MTDMEEIVALYTRLGHAHRNKDAEGIVACYSRNALVFSLAPPLKNIGVNHDETASWLSTWDGPVIVGDENVEIVIEGEIAWKTALTNMQGVKTDGTEENLWYRSTMCLRKIDGEWLIVHDHSSTPFYMDGSLKAAVDLSPQSSESWDASS